MTHRALLPIASVALAASLTAVDQPLHIVVILTDDVGYGDLSINGAKDIATPNLDALLRRGVYCTNAYVTAPICAPSRASLLTGRQPIRLGMTANHQALPADERTLAERLKETGWATACFGKWHLGSGASQVPTSRGFDEFVGGLSHSVNTTPAETMADVEKGLDFLARNRDRPAFLYQAIGAAHAPYAKRNRQDLAKVDAAITDQGRRNYAASVLGLDAAIGRLTAELDARRAWDRTLVIFFNDNGGKLVDGARSAPLRDGKYSYYEGGIRVPCGIIWQGRLPSCAYDGLVSTLDVVPTCLAAAGLPPCPGLDGSDLLPALRAAKAPGRVLAWAGLTTSSAGPDWFVVRQDRWKLIVNKSGEELYDLAADPGETANRAQTEPATLAAMRRVLEQERSALVGR